jgi:hypothetical protein
MVEVIGPIVMGVLIGIVDLVFMIKDESGDAKTVMGHGLGALVYLIPLSFVAFNLGFLNNLTFLPEFVRMEWVSLVGLGLIAGIIVHAKSGLFKKARGRGTHVTWVHSFIIGVLVVVGPYIWESFVGPIVGEYIG